ncbi:hypothetical protein CVT26_001621 [Gymnopilus dilepis]|uniref:Mid2 domain-containing protein n=1 Tax=Gymnopilus dilepis TaxID=231916 RepID=A0A409WAX0_9AGAR|nr:hypothetical protein CVT26_001621 [Gymnopilus dilepis]
MSVQKVAVDDTDPSVVYSGQWSVQRSASAYGNSLHVSTSAGASASLSFTGISVNILGTIPPCTVTGSPVTYQVVLDASPVDWGTAACTTSTQNNVLFYSSTQLSNGPHKVTIIDEANESPMLMLDLFAYVTSSEGGGGAAGTSAVGGAAGTTLSASVLSHPTTSSQDAGMTSSATSAQQSSTPSNSASTTSTSSGKTSSGDQATSSAQSSASDSLPTPTNSQPSSNNSNNSSLSQSSTTSHSHSTGPIIGGVVAAVLVLTLLVLFLFYHLRKRKGRQPSYTSKIVMPFNLNLNLRRGGADPESPLGASGGESHQNSTSELIERGRSTTVRALSDSGNNHNHNNNNRPLERSMPNNIVPFILDGVAVGAGRQQAELVVPGSARPSSVLDPEYASGLGGPPSAASEKARLVAGDGGASASGGAASSSSPSSAAAHVTPSWHPDEKRRSGPRSPAANPGPHLSATPSDAAPAYMLDPDPGPIPSPPIAQSDAHAESNTHSPLSNNHKTHQRHLQNQFERHQHYPSGLSASSDLLSGIGTGTGMSSEVPPAYNDCCAYPGPHHHHHDHQH